MTRLLCNARGQAAIFIALIFQVLFVLFAMTINVALVIHDKINLQNAVDLAAFYAAERQAEQLNAIAHINYQVRQAWKLLAWRYRVLSTMGFDRQNDFSFHPARSGIATETLYLEAMRPSVCVTYAPNWFEVPKGQNLCNRPNLKIPELPQVPLIAGFIGINAAVTALSQQLILAFNASCDLFGAYNWWYAMGILQSYRIEQRNRKLLIYSLARNLSAKPDDFVDLNGGSAKTGAYQTLFKNLTYANRISPITFEMLNSLQGADPQLWLPEVKINPTLYYTDVAVGPGCNAVPRLLRYLPGRDGAKNKLLDVNTLNAAQLLLWAQGEPPPTDPYSFSLGVEKNPWYMAYVGVRATTTPRQIFFPFGPSVTLTAHGFAQPFGGRIGPWYGAQWPQGSAQSIGEQVDVVVPPRPKSDGFLDNPDDPRRLPNYGRFPGDIYGLTTRLAQASLAKLNNQGIKFAYFKHIYQDFTMATNNDTLPWDYQLDLVPDYRYFELAAVAPDLFDITYYSIDPNFAVNYLAPLRANAAALKIPPDLPIRGDLGTHEPQFSKYSVQDQIRDVQDRLLQIPDAFYFVRNRENLLTGWAEGEGAVNYVFPTDRFGRCPLSDDGFKDKVPGSCVSMGGRTGYSVKLISRNALNSSQNRVGGKGVPPGPLVNSPNSLNW